MEITRIEPYNLNDNGCVGTTIPQYPTSCPASIQQLGVDPNGFAQDLTMMNQRFSILGRGPRRVVFTGLALLVIGFLVFCSTGTIFGGIGGIGFIIGVGGMACLSIGSYLMEKKMNNAKVLLDSAMQQLSSKYEPFGLGFEMKVFRSWTNVHSIRGHISTTTNVVYAICITQVDIDVEGQETKPTMQ